MTETSAQIHPTALQATLQDRLIELIGSIIEPMGYEVVHLEIVTQRQRLLRLYIDRLAPEATEAASLPAIGIEDCVKVTRALDEPLEKFSEIDGVFKGTYELEVSSPGVDRPLRQAKDYSRFAGREARIHVFRPLSAQELAAEPAPGSQYEDYQKRNPRQKNFIGTLNGVQNGKVLLTVSTGSDSGSQKKNGRISKSVKKTTNRPEGGGLTIAIPLPLISKANLEPKFDFDSLESDL